MKSIPLRLLVILFIFLGSSCQDEDVDASPTLRMLYNAYEDGEIQECSLEGEVYYKASRNVVDSPSVVFDAEGAQVGECNPAWGRVDPICEQLSGCEVIYRVSGHISGQPAVDKYGLSR